MSYTNNQTRKLVTVGVLAALGTVLMILEIPYPFTGFLAIDLSDVVVLMVFALYGWKEAATVGALKAIVHILFKGAVGPMAVGQIIAFVASMAYVLGMYVASVKFKLNKIVSAIVTVLIVTLLLTIGNYFIFTPMWFGEIWFTQLTGDQLSYLGTGAGMQYFITIISIYVPFNLIKGSIILIVYNILNEILNVYLTNRETEN